MEKIPVSELQRLLQYAGKEDISHVQSQIEGLGTTLNNLNRKITDLQFRPSEYDSVVKCKVGDSLQEAADKAYDIFLEKKKQIEKFNGQHLSAWNNSRVFIELEPGLHIVKEGSVVTRGPVSWTSPYYGSAKVEFWGPTLGKDLGSDYTYDEKNVPWLDPDNTPFCFLFASNPDDSPFNYGFSGMSNLEITGGDNCALIVIEGTRNNCSFINNRFLGYGRTHKRAKYGILRIPDFKRRRELNEWDAAIKSPAFNTDSIISNNFFESVEHCNVGAGGEQTRIINNFANCSVTFVHLWNCQRALVNANHICFVPKYSVGQLAPKTAPIVLGANQKASSRCDIGVNYIADQYPSHLICSNNVKHPYWKYKSSFGYLKSEMEVDSAKCKISSRSGLSPLI